MQPLAPLCPPVTPQVGLGRLAALGDRLAWVREALPGVEEEDGTVSCASMLQLIEGILTRFDDEVSGAPPPGQRQDLVI